MSNEKVKCICCKGEGVIFKDNAELFSKLLLNPQLNWRDPKVELPEEDYTILVLIGKSIQRGYYDMDISKFMGYGFTPDYDITEIEAWLPESDLLATQPKTTEE